MSLNIFWFDVVEVFSSLVWISEIYVGTVLWLVWHKHILKWIPQSKLIPGKWIKYYLEVSSEEREVETLFTLKEMEDFLVFLCYLDLLILKSTALPKDNKAENVIEYLLVWCCWSVFFSCLNIWNICWYCPLIGLTQTHLKMNSSEQVDSRKMN